jgi:hypothetical protein
MSFAIRLLAALFLCWSWCSPAWAISTVDVATITPAYQAPGWTGWTPASLGSALKARWTASSLSAGAVSSWADTVAALTLTQATGASQPVQAATTCNGFPGVAFDGTDDELTAAATTGLPTGSTAGEIWVAADPTINGTTGVAVSYGLSGASASRQVRKVGDAPNITDGTVNLTDARAPGNTASFSNVIAWGGQWSGTTETARVNGRPFANVSATIASLNTNTTRTRFGANVAATAATFLAMTLCEVDITTALSLADQQRMEAYLLYAHRREAALPYDHPYRWRKP